MGIKLGKALDNAVKGVSGFVDKTGKRIAKAIDQNGDGKLDFSDIQTVSDRIQANKAEARRKADIEKLKPVFPDDFEGAGFVLPKMIHIAEMDKAHADNPVCEGSIGFRTVLDEMSALTIYRDKIDAFGLTFYPELDYSVYYVDPCDRDHYILMNVYFSYMKMQRVAELQRIAQSLGATHFRVTYKEKSKSVASKTIDAAISVSDAIQGAGAGVKASRSTSDSLLSSMSIEAEMRFPGHAPVRPELHYLKKEINIVNLIELRMDPFSPLQQQRFNIELINSSGIREKDAVKIDAILKSMKISGNTTFVSEVQNEARRILEYEIEF